MPIHLIIGAAIVAAAFFGGWQVNGWRIDAAQKRADNVEQRAAASATAAAVDAIKGIEVKYVPIKTKAEIVTRDVVVYRDCIHDPAGLQLVNEALAGGSGSGPSDAPRVP